MSVLETLVVYQVVVVPKLYAARRFVTDFWRPSPHWSISCITWIQSKLSHLISLRSVVLYPVSSSTWMFSKWCASFWGFPCHCALIFSAVPTTCCVHLYLDMIILIHSSEDWKLWNSSSCKFLRLSTPPLPCFPPHTDVFLSALLSNAPSLFSSLTVRSHVSWPHKQAKSYYFSS